MRHARPLTLDALGDLLESIRRDRRLTERRKGAFYRGQSAFLHFHEDDVGLYADLRTGVGWARVPVASAQQRRGLLAQVLATLDLRERWSADPCGW